MTSGFKSSISKSSAHNSLIVGATISGFLYLKMKNDISIICFWLEIEEGELLSGITLPESNSPSLLPEVCPENIHGHGFHVFRSKIITAADYFVSGGLEQPNGLSEIPVQIRQHFLRDLLLCTEQL